jgi:hypothetical protein
MNSVNYKTVLVSDGWRCFRYIIMTRSAWERKYHGWHDKVTVSLRPTRSTNFANLFLTWNSTCLGQFLCPSLGVYSLYAQQWYMSYRLVDSFRAGSGWNHPSPACKLCVWCLYDKYHCWVYSEWTPDDCQRHCPRHVEFHVKNKFAKLVDLVGLIIKKFVVMHGHMNVTKNVGKVKYGTPTRCNNNSFLLIFKISSTCFGQVFAHLQERKTEIFLQHMV